APTAGELEGQADHAPDLGLRVPQGVDGNAPLCGIALLRGPAEVQARGELADDQEVSALEDLGPNRRRRHEGGQLRRRPEVRQQLEAAAQGEQRLLRPDLRVRVVPAWP